MQARLVSSRQLDTDCMIADIGKRSCTRLNFSQSFEAVERQET